MSDQHEWSIFTGGGKRCMKILRNTDAVMGAILIVAPEDPGPAIGASACELRHGIMHFCPAQCTMDTKPRFEHDGGATCAAAINLDSPPTDIEESASRRKFQRCLVTFVLFPSWADNQAHYSDNGNQAPKSQKKAPKQFSHNSMLH
jgi:hypothetical protein